MHFTSQMTYNNVNYDIRYLEFNCAKLRLQVLKLIEVSVKYIECVTNVVKSIYASKYIVFKNLAF